MDAGEFLKRCEQRQPSPPRDQRNRGLVLLPNEADNPIHALRCKHGIGGAQKMDRGTSATRPRRNPEVN